MGLIFFSTLVFLNINIFLRTRHYNFNISDIFISLTLKLWCLKFLKFWKVVSWIIKKLRPSKIIYGLLSRAKYETYYVTALKLHPTLDIICSVFFLGGLTKDQQLLSHPGLYGDGANTWLGLKAFNKIISLSELSPAEHNVEMTMARACGK